MKISLLSKNRDRRGFTIIEVMIVLAIAGLILAVVLLAVPALQRSQRNNARSSDATHWAGIVSDYVSNHGGSQEPAGAIAVPSGDNFSQLTSATAAAWVAADTDTTKVSASTTAAAVVTGATCNTATGALSAQAGSFVIVWGTEPTAATPTTANFDCING
jgi:prepilin-type N-terminal cleavage/methylation domain-containing protein